MTFFLFLFLGAGMGGIIILVFTSLWLQSFAERTSNKGVSRAARVILLCIFAMISILFLAFRENRKNQLIRQSVSTTVANINLLRLEYHNYQVSGRTVKLSFWDKCRDQEIILSYDITAEKIPEKTTVGKLTIIRKNEKIYCIAGER